MKRSYAGFWICTAFLFTAAIYSAIVFLVKPVFDISTWVLYGFTMVAFLLTAFQALLTFRKSCDIFTETAFRCVTLIYFGLQFTFGGIICMYFHDLPLTAVLVWETILLAAYLVSALIMYGVQSHSASQDWNDRNAVCKMRLWEGDILNMAERQEDAAKKLVLQSLADEIRYSDVSVAVCPALTEVEDHIARNIAILQKELTNETGDVYARIEVVRRLLKERNRAATILKR